MFRTTTIAFALALTVPTVVLAASGTPAEQHACRHDVVRHCRDVMNESDQRVAQCLSLKAASLSKACQDVLRAHGQL